MKPRMLPVAPDGCVYFRNTEGLWWVSADGGYGLGATWQRLAYVVIRRMQEKDA